MPSLARRFLTFASSSVSVPAALVALCACSASELELFPIDQDASLCATLDGSGVVTSPGNGGLGDGATTEGDGGTDVGEEGGEGDSGGIQAPPPPWQIDGGYDPDAGCAGQTLANGECLVTLAAGLPNPWGIAIDTQSVYFTGSGTGPTSFTTASVAKVGRSGGSVVTLVSGQRVAHGIAVDAENVYWDGDAITAVGINGGTPVTIFDDDNSTTSFVTRVGARVYWANSEYDFGARSAAIDGSGYTKLTPYIEVDGLARSSLGLVWNQDADGMGPTALMSDDLGAGSTTSIYAGGGGLLKSAGDTVVFIQGQGTMYSLALTGGPLTFLASGTYVTDLVTDGFSVYWTDQALRAVMKLSLGDGAPVTLASGEDDPDIWGTGSLTMDSSSIYFTEPGGCSQAGVCAGKVFKLSPR
jgi:hypothetical protein